MARVLLAVNTAPLVGLSRSAVEVVEGVTATAAALDQDREASQSVAAVGPVTEEAPAAVEGLVDPSRLAEEGVTAAAAPVVGPVVAAAAAAPVLEDSCQA